MTMLTKVEVTFTCEVHSEEMEEDKLIKKLQILPLRLTTNGVIRSGIISFESNIIPKIKIIK